MTQQPTLTSKTSLETVRQILLAINECYPGKFNKTEKTKKIWHRMLKDIDAENVLAATFHLCATVPTWPPDVASIRQQAVRYAHGEMEAPTGHEAWENIRKKFGNDHHQLTDHEKAAVNQIGSMFDLKRSENTVADRAQFIKAFDNIIAKRDLDRATLPEVKALVENNVPFLPEHEEPAPQLPPPATQNFDYSTLNNGTASTVNTAPTNEYKWNGYGHQPQEDPAPGEQPTKAEIHDMLKGLGLTEPDDTEEDDVPGVDFDPILLSLGIGYRF